MKLSKGLGFIGALLATLTVAFTTGCASGGYSLTRQYARWVNSQNIILRIIIYLLTGIVFAVTMLIDLVVFNTMDFWTGKVSQGVYEFDGEGKTFLVEHRLLPGSGLKHSTIKVSSTEGKLLQEVILRETASGQIEMLVDGARRALVDDFASLPQVSVFDVKGSLLKHSALWAEMPMIPARFMARR